MRNAVAHFDDDFDIREPARKAARKSGGSRSGSGRKKKKTKGRWWQRRPDVDMQKVARYAAIGMSATVALGIMVNALALQKSRHPAPLFGKSIALGQPVTPAASNPAPKPAVAAIPQPVAKPTEAQLPAPVSRQAAAMPHDGSADAIGQLLQTGSVPADHGDARTVAAAQRALANLGFAVKATGTVGPQTKKAVEAYEKAHHLPIKGELSSRMIKRIVADSAAKDDR